jgi:dTDP-glucose 4,6-dehydratase
MLETALAANRELALDMEIFAQSRDPERFLARVPHLRAGVTWVASAPLALEAAQFGSRGLDAIVHLVTEADGAATRARPNEARATILGSTERALALARATGVRHFLFTSSGSVYFRDGARVPCAESAPLHAEADGTSSVAAIGGAAKRAAEEACARAAAEWGLHATVARCFAFVGPHLSLAGKFAIGNFMCDALEGRDVVLSGDGTAVRSYLYASDLAAWLWRVMFRAPAGEAYNVGSAREVSLREAAELIVREVAPGRKIQVLGAPTGMVDYYVPDTQRIERELGVRETVALDEAVRRTANWCRTHLRG